MQYFLQVPLLHNILKLPFVGLSSVLSIRTLSLQIPTTVSQHCGFIISQTLEPLLLYSYILKKPFSLLLT